MARDALQIMLRTFVGLLSALAFSSGIFIGRGEGGVFPHNDSYLDPGPQTRILGAESPDLTYCNMILDAPVPPTADQVPWFCTCTLCKGDNTEPKGDRGDRGLPGQPGSPGRRGLTGSLGPPGLRGPPGVKGQKGEEGTKGAQGPSGFLGKKGQHGIKGEKGDMGIEGRPGDLGPAGEPGDCPASCDYVRGPPGDVGLPGIVGPRGLPGPTGFPGAKGHKGDKGDIGQPGAQGAEGIKGDHGIQGVCNCKNGTKGTSGEQGIAGSKGEKGDLGLQGHTGVGGVKGDKGELGMTGIPGPCSPAIQSAFSAKLVNIYPVPDQPVPFAAVIYNAQFHYNPSTGVYRAPLNGTYVFSYNLVAYGKTLKVGLFLNFKPVVKSTEIVNFGTVSQRVVLHLSMGDQVWLQVKDANNNGLYAGPEYNSIFSGLLLNPDSCDMPLSRNLFPEIVDYNYSSGPYSWDIE